MFKVELMRTGKKHFIQEIVGRGQTAWRMGMTQLWAGEAEGQKPLSVSVKTEEGF
jgi:hypothetical protein